MKVFKKLLFCTLILTIGIFVYGGQVYAETDCSKYACATCVYTSGTRTATYTISSDGAGNLTVVPKLDLGVSGARLPAFKNGVSDTDIFKDFDNNQLVCSNLYIVQSMSASETVYTVQSSAGSNGTLMTLDPSSTNNNKPIVDNNNVNNYKSCDFKDSTTGITCTVQSNNGQFSSVDCGNFKYDNSKSDISGIDFSKQCSQIKLYLYCDRSTGACVLNQNQQYGTTSSGTTTEGGSITGDASYSCNYKGKVNGKNLTIRKFTDKWEVSNNGETISYPVNSTKGNSFPTTDCEDIFYIENSGVGSYHIVEANSIHTDTTISTWCNGYGNEVEQFCENGNCKIENPQCGNTIVDDDSGNGEGCPWQLRAVIIFLKKIAFNTVQLVVPILLIVMGTIDFTKAVASPDEKGNQEAVSKFIKRCLAAIIVFFIGTIVTIVMNMFSATDMGAQNDWKTCWESID